MLERVQAEERRAWRGAASEGGITTSLLGPSSGSAASRSSRSELTGARLSQLHLGHGASRKVGQR